MTTAAEQANGGANILHVDMDAFYASIEQRRRPELVGRPVVVGGDAERGVVAAASYEARVHGVYSAMSSVRARRLCPDAVFLPADIGHYAEVSRRVMTILRSATPLVEPLSLDEAFLDVSGSRRLHGDPVTIAHRIRDQIFESEGLMCGIGVARPKFIAKMASKAAKPRVGAKGITEGPGVVEIRPGEELDFLHPMTVDNLWGVGPATLAKLNRVGVRTIGQLVALAPETVVAALGQAQGQHLHALASGIDPRPVIPDQVAKSVGHEETFSHDLFRPDDLQRELRRMADLVGSRLRKEGLAGRTIAVKVRFGDFRTISRSHTLDGPTASTHDLIRVGLELLGGVDPSSGVRLLGISVAQLNQGESRQLSFDDIDGGDEDRRRAEEAVDEIRRRFGAAAVSVGRLAKKGQGARCEPSPAVRD